MGLIKTLDDYIEIVGEPLKVLPYWVEADKIWTKTSLANGKNRIYVYYGNEDAPDYSDGDDTFVRIIDGLAGAWHFDEGSGTTTYDTSGNGNDGIINGATWVDGKFGKALSFDGSDYVDCGNDESLNITDEITIEAWVKPNALTTSYIVSKAEECGNEATYNLRISDTGKVIFSYYDGTGANNFYQTDDTIAINNWYHIVVAYNYQTNVIQIYINGELVSGSWKDNNIPNNPTPVTTPNQLFIGATRVYYNSAGCSGFAVGDPKDCFNGTIDEVRIYNKVLSEEEIIALYNYYGYTTINYSNKVLICKYTDPEPTVTYGDEETGNWTINGYTYTKRKKVIINSSIELTDYQVALNYNEFQTNSIVITK